MKRSVFLIMVILSAALLLCFSAYAETESTVALDGVQLRLADGEVENGLRFIAKVKGEPSDYYDFGIVVAQADSFTGELTPETENTVTVRFNGNDAFRFFYDGNDGYFRYTACVIGISFEDYDKALVARPFAVVNEGDAPIYGENYSDYEESFFGFSEKILELYSDRYTPDDRADYDKVDKIVTDYNQYVNEIITEEIDLVDVDHTPVNEWYFEIGTIGGSNGIINTTNNKRIYTPNLIPYDEQTITFDGASGVYYGVLFYDEQGEFITGINKSWTTEQSLYLPDITPNTDGADLSRAAYIRFVMRKNVNNADQVITLDDIKELSSHLSVSYLPAEVSGGSDSTEASWLSGYSLSGSTGAIGLRSGKDRIANETYYPISRTSFSYSGDETVQYLIMEYDSDYKWLGGDYTTSWTTASSYSPKSGDAKYFRIAMRYSNNRENLTDDDIAVMTAGLEITVERTDSRATFFKLGEITSDGTLNTSASAIYGPGYIPVTTGFDFVSDSGYTYALAYYDSEYNFVTLTDAVTDAHSDINKTYAYYRPVVYYTSEVSDVPSDIAANFTFYEDYDIITASDWTGGYTIKGQGVMSADTRGRLATADFYLLEGMDISFEGSGTIGIFGYTEPAEASYIGSNTGDISSSSAAATKLKALISAGAKYGRFYLKAKTAFTSATEGLDEIVEEQSAFINISVKGKNVFEPVKVKRPAAMSIVKKDGLISRIAYTKIPAGYTAYGAASGFCLIEDEVWTYRTSDTGTATSDNDGYGTITRYKMNFEDGTYEFVGQFEHNFGHMNSVDYNPDTKALTFGSGSSKFTATENYFYIYENIYDVVTSYTGDTVQKLELSDAISYHFDNSVYYDAAGTNMTKINSCFYSDNCLLINANNNGFVFKVALGTGERQLSKGTYIEGKGENEYNGTYEFIKAYEMPDNKKIDQNGAYIGQHYAECNQGTEYFDGTLYLTCGHDGVYFWECRLDSTDADGDGLCDIVRTREFHKYMYENDKNGMAGIGVTEDYLMLGSGGYVNVFEFGADM